MKQAKAEQRLIAIGARLSDYVMAIAAATLLIGLIVFSLVATKDRSSRIVGTLVPENGVTEIRAPQSGTVLKLAVKEGQRVVAGDPIAEVGDRSGSRKGDTQAMIERTLEERVRSLEAERRLLDVSMGQRRAALVERSRSLERELATAEEEEKQAASRTSIAGRAVERNRQLRLEGFLSEAQLQIKEDELLDAAGRERAARRLIESLKREAQQTKDDLTALDTSTRSQGAKLEADAAQATRELLEQSQRSSAGIKALRGGAVLAVHVKEGSSIVAGELIATVIPSLNDGSGAPLLAEFEVPAESTATIREGMAVRMRYAAYPFTKYGTAEGTVASVRRSSAPTQSGSNQQFRGTSAANRVVVKLESQTFQSKAGDVPLFPGMTVEATVRHERRSLMAWLFDPVMRALAN